MQLLTGEKLLERFKDLAGRADEIDIAVAWMTLGGGLTSILKRIEANPNVRVRAVVGVSGHITCPKALRCLGAAGEVFIIKGSNQLFHPKFYRFRLGERVVCLVGSANLTKRAFSSNFESVVQCEDDSETSLTHFLSFWNLPTRVSLGDFDLEAYEEERDNLPEDIKRLIPEMESSAATADEPASSGLEELPSSWPEYVNLLRLNDGELRDCVRTLDAGWAIVGRDWSKDFTSYEADVVFGRGDFKAFGHLERLGSPKLRGESKEARKSRRLIGEILQRLRRMTRFHKDLARKEIDNLLDINGCGLALSTRLLAFARPDWFVVVNKRSVEQLRDFFGFHVNAARKKLYLELVENILRQRWLDVPTPSDAGELALWGYRVALIEVLIRKDSDQNESG